MVTSACLPVYSGMLVGVTCVDITMSDLLSDVTYFNEGELSYAFIIDNKARLLMHPLLPQPYAVQEEPIYVDMLSLETFTGADAVVNSMLRQVILSITDIEHEHQRRRAGSFYTCHIV